MGVLNGGNHVIVFIGLGLIGMGLLEAVVLSRLRPGSYDWKGHHVSLATTVMRGFTDWIPLSFLLPGGAWLYEHRLFDIPLNTFWGLLVLLLSQEFCYYWFHRASHRVRWFWANHAVHHSPNQYTLSSAYRLGITGKVTGMLLWFLPMCLIGFTPKVVVISFVANLLFQFWIHAEWIPKLGWLEGIINTASAHRVHHAANLEYLDANYGGVLLVFDRLFGTYVPERDDIKARYGLVKPVDTYNPIKVCFWEYGPLLRDLRKARSAREVLGYLFAPPGWAPDGQGQTTEDMRREASTLKTQ
jgi:sterol desaturase/sphingolipid hydroxylase (fatty acid hydroxylase superfamily)